MGFKYGDATYYYIQNLQGDIVGILDSTGNQIVSYSYSAWGEPVSTTGSAATTIGVKNPFRYRGYYYDTESQLYYLNSRYYDSSRGRFLNADGYISVAQSAFRHNMFTYCDNNFVNSKDPGGEFWITALLVTAAVSLCAVVMNGCTSKTAKSSKTKPSNYIEDRSKDRNCYSYAFKLPKAANPGDYSLTKANPDYMYKSKTVYTPQEITNYVKRDMSALKRSVSVVNSPSDKTDKEYIVAMKTSNIIIASIGVADYHFAVQLSDGTWADKPGQTPSRWNALDGTAISWDCGNIEGYYNKESIYFAVEY